MSKALKMEFLRNVIFLNRSWVFMIEEAFQSEFSVFTKKNSCYPSTKKNIDQKLVMNRENLLHFTRAIYS